MEPGLRLLSRCRDLGISEVSAYGFTKENVHRPTDQVRAFQRACVDLALGTAEAGAGLLVVGDADSPVFPRELLPFAEHRAPGTPRFNLLVNYGWRWDLFSKQGDGSSRGAASMRSHDVSRVDLVVRWGGRRRLSGFLPVQCAYADFFVVDRLWPEMQDEDFEEALHWYARQDVTLGG